MVTVSIFFPESTSKSKSMAHLNDGVLDSVHDSMRGIRELSCIVPGQPVAMKLWFQIRFCFPAGFLHPSELSDLKPGVSKQHQAVTFLLFFLVSFWCQT